MFDLKQEFAQLVTDGSIDWSKIDGKSILITGATGLIGSYCAHVLLERNRLFDARIKVFALIRDRKKAEIVFCDHNSDNDLVFCEGDLITGFHIEQPVSYVIHAGCPTASEFFMTKPVETSRSIVDGTLNVLEIATRNNASMVYVSSMEVYGDGNPERGIEKLLNENMVGYVNPLSVRSCYPEGKRMAENYCSSYAAEYGTQVSVARLAQTFGPGIPANDKRIFAYIARNAMSGEDVVLKTTGESTRMYLYTADAARAIFAILLRGEKGSAYNVANESTYSSVREMAEMVVSEFSNGASKVIIDVDPNAPYPPEHHLPLDTAALRKLGWSPQYDLREMFKNLICSFEN